MINIFKFFQSEKRKLTNKIINDLNMVNPKDICFTKTYDKFAHSVQTLSITTDKYDLMVQSMVNITDIVPVRYYTYVNGIDMSDKVISSELMIHLGELYNEEHDKQLNQLINILNS